MEAKALAAFICLTAVFFLEAEGKFLVACIVNGRSMD